MNSLEIVRLWQSINNTVWHIVHRKLIRKTINSYSPSILKYKIDHCLQWKIREKVWDRVWGEFRSKVFQIFDNGIRVKVGEFNNVKK